MTQDLWISASDCQDLAPFRSDLANCKPVVARWINALRRLVSWYQKASILNPHKRLTVRIIGDELTYEVQPFDPSTRTGCRNRDGMRIALGNRPIPRVGPKQHSARCQRACGHCGRLAADSCERGYSHHCGRRCARFGIARRPRVATQLSGVHGTRATTTASNSWGGVRLHCHR